MRRLAIISALLAAFALSAHTPAEAQNASPRQIQGLITSGQEQSALDALHAALQAHPDSAVAWYLTAEAQDASGNESAAASALANAEHFAPGLPFANPNDVAALQAHVAGTPANGAPLQRHSGFSPVMLGIVGLVILFFALRMFLRPRRSVAPNGYPANYGPAGYGPTPGPYPYGSGGMGSGLGGSLLGGLAAGAGFAAGERVIDNVFGNNNGQGGNFQQDQNSGNGGVPERDDGLTGNPGWDNSGSDQGGNDQGGNFDPGNNW